MNKAYSALLMLASMPLHATSIYVDFNSPDDLANGFSQQFPNNPAPSQTGGIGNTGSLVGSGRATYNNTSFDFSEYGSKITVSTSFFLDLKDDLTEGLGYTWGLIYLVPEANSYLYTDDSLFVDFSSSYPTGGELEDRIFGGPLQQGGGGFPGFHDVFTPGTYIEGHWYELATTFENLNGQIGFHTKVNDYGVDGGTFVGTAAESYNVTSDPHGFTSDSSVYAGFLLNSNAQALDNFYVSSIPIPASFWLFGSGLLGLIGMARRKKAA